jgi:NYN domain
LSGASWRSIEPRLAAADADPLYGRVLHLVDVENLLGGPTFSADRAIRGRLAYEAVVPGGIVNQVVISTSHWAAPSAWIAWPESARRVVRSGPDGADLALLDVLSYESVERRFDRVVIGSGDGIFAFAAARLQAAGCGVTVATRPESLSRKLRLAVRDIRFIETRSLEPLSRRPQDHHATRSKIG